MIDAERKELVAARDKLKFDLEWRGPTGRMAALIVLDRARATTVLALIECALRDDDDPDFAEVAEVAT